MGTCTLSHKIIYCQNPFRKLLGLKKKIQNVTHKVEQQSNGQFTRGKHIHGIKCQGKLNVENRLEIQQFKHQIPTLESV